MGHKARKSLKKLTEDGNVDGFAVTVVRVPTNLSRRLYNGVMESDTRLEVSFVSRTFTPDSASQLSPVL